MMKQLFIFLVAFSFSNSSFAQSETAVTKIFIVRHAEKESGNDPDLTAAGKIRAGDLMRTLQSEGVQKIYVSKTRRSQNTADSMRIQLHISAVQYDADTLCEKLIAAIMENRDFGKTILIIGHSNTIPQIIRKLGVKDYPYGDLGDTEYDNLFVISYKKEKAILKTTKFGAKSGPSAAMK